MQFSYTPEQTALATSVARYCERDYSFDHRRAVLSEQSGFSRSHWSRFAELGWLGAGLPEEAQGYGGGPVETMILAEAFGRRLVVEPFMATAVLALQTLASLPKTALRDDLVGAMITGETLVAMAHMEAAGRGDETFAEARLEDGRLFGRKSVVLAAPQADKLLVSARDGGELSLYLVDATQARSYATPYRLLDNTLAADLVLDGLQPEAVLARGRDAETAIAEGYGHALVCCCAEAVGAMDAAITMTRDYLKTRKQFGVTLGSFQALQHRMADMLVELEMSRSIVFHGVAALSLPPSQRVRALSAMKVVVSAASSFVGRNAVQLHGAIGMTEEHAIGHYYRKLFVSAAMFGTESLHLSRLAAKSRGFWSEQM